MAQVLDTFVAPLEHKAVDLHADADRADGAHSAHVPKPRPATRFRATVKAVTGTGYRVLLLVLLVATLLPPLVGIQLLSQDARWTCLRIFAVVMLSSYPAFLFARFVRFRASAMWEDFVLNLHRLALDRPRHLPQPLENSPFAQRWQADGGMEFHASPSIYERKFEASYGEGATRSKTEQVLAFGHVTPIYALTLLLAVSWTAVLWGLAPLVSITAPLPTLTAMAFGFLGTYAFALQTLIRRYFHGDLRPAAYMGLVQRFLFVSVSAYALHQVVGGSVSIAAEAALLFLIGFFPMTAIQVLRVVAAKSLAKLHVKNMDSAYPLSDLDGMSIWAEARFLELAVEDVQNLATANITDVLLQSRVPVARLVDWIDQSLLYLHTPDKGRSRDGSPQDIRGVLRAHGIRKASDLVRVFECASAGQTVRHQDIKAIGAALQNASGGLVHNGVSALRAMASAISDEPNLYHVQQWKAGEEPDDGPTAPPTPTAPNGLHRTRTRFAGRSLRSASGPASLYKAEGGGTTRKGVQRNDADTTGDGRQPGARCAANRIVRRPAPADRGDGAHS